MSLKTLVQTAVAAGKDGDQIYRELGNQPDVDSQELSDLLNIAFPSLEAEEDVPL